MLSSAAVWRLLVSISLSCIDCTRPILIVRFDDPMLEDYKGFITFKELSTVGLPRCDLEGDNVTLQQLSISTSSSTDKSETYKMSRSSKLT